MLFISPKKLISIIKYFVLALLVVQKNELVRKLRLVSEFMTSQTWKLIITIHRGLELVSLPHFLHEFSEKKNSMLYLLTD